MTPEIALTLVIIAGALLLFAADKLRVDLVALLVLLAVALTGLVDQDEVFAGFANSAVITVWAAYMVSEGMLKTGVAAVLGDAILRLSGKSEVRLIAVIMLVCGLISAFINNVGATAMLIPAVVTIGQRARIPVSKLLIPLAFSSLLGGKLTMIGTPANILATSIVADYGLPTFGFFDFAPIGIVVFVTGILYMVLVGRHLLPVRQAPDQEETERRLRDYISELRVLQQSRLAGRTLYESRLGAEFDVTVVAIDRQGIMRTSLHRETRLYVDDLLVVKGAPENLVRAAKAQGLAIVTEPHVELAELEDEGAHMVEATLGPRSTMVDRSLSSIQFRERYGFNVLAIRREGEVLTDRLRGVRLRYGDALLLQGPRHRLPALNEHNDFLVLEPVTIPERRRRKMPIAIGIMVLVVASVLATGLHIATAMVIGAVAMILTGCLTIEEAHESVDWRTVFLVGGMLSLGVAMETSGTAEYLADLLLGAVGGLGPMAALGAIYLLAALITQPMSNAAAMVLVVPIALDTALSLGANHLTFTLAVVIGAATSFLTPVGHKANVLVFGPGGYRFADYARVGALLTAVLFIVTMVALPILYPLFP